MADEESLYFILDCYKSFVSARKQKITFYTIRNIKRIITIKLLYNI